MQRPCVLTAVKEFNVPRYMTVLGIENAYRKDITVWDENDLNLSAEDCGINASPTKVMKSFTPPPKSGGEMIEGSVSEMANTLVQKLKEKHFL